MLTSDGDLTNSQTRPRPWWLDLTLVLLLIAAVHINVIGFEFVYDDQNQIVSNPTIQSWSYLPHIFTGHAWSHKTSTVLYYRPLFSLWLLLNYMLFGLDPAGWHLAALALHLAATALVYGLARGLRLPREVALAAALLFGLFPAHVEAVDWVSGATEPLFAVLFLGSFLLYVKSRYWASVAVFAAAMLSKETAVAMPAVVAAYEWYVGGEHWVRRAAKRAAPYIAVGALYVVIRRLALKTFAHRMESHSALEIVATWPAVIGFYIRHTLWPAGLSVFYNFDFVARPGFWNFAVPAALIAAAAGALYFASRRSRVTGFLAWWFLLLLLPVLNLTIFGNGELVHDRYLYAPSMAVCILAAMAIAAIRAKPLRLAALAALGCLYAAGTVYEGRFWENGVTLNQRGLQIAPGNVTATHNLGIALMSRGQQAQAVPHLLEALARQPRSEETLFALGLCYFDMDSLPEAERYFLRAIEADPQDPKAHLFLGVTRAKQRSMEEAEGEIRRAIGLLRVPTGYKKYHLALAAVLAERGDSAGALKEYQLELVNDPDSDDARNGMDAMRERLRATAR